MQAYVRTAETECPVQIINEYGTARGVPVVEVIVSGYPGVSRYRALTVPTSEVTIR